MSDLIEKRSPQERLIIAKTLLDGVIKDFPSAQPERKMGKWILSDDRDWKTCSECGADVDVSMGIGVYVDNDEVSEMCFCPNCGADMRGESE